MIFYLSWPRYIDGRKEDVLLQCQEKLEEATADCKSKEESKEKFYQDLEKIAVKRIARERQLDDNIRLACFRFNSRLTLW